MTRATRWSKQTYRQIMALYQRWRGEKYGDLFRIESRFRVKA